MQSIPQRWYQLTSDSYCVVNTFISETFTSFSTAGGFSNPIVMRYDYVGISGL